VPTATDALTEPPETDAPDPRNHPPGGRAASGASRRGLFVAAGAVGLAACTPPPRRPGGGTTTTAAPASPPTTAPAPPLPTGALTAALLVDKLTFGPRPGLAAAVEARGLAEWIEDQLRPSERGVPDAEARLAGCTTLRNTHRQNYDVQAGPAGAAQLEAELDWATIRRAVSSERQLFELMCDFWRNHFNVWRHHTWMTFLITRDHETVIRPHALGKFSEMLSASAHSTAMLDYLDNLPSDASAPGGVNENYARELLELHTLGIIDGQKAYTEADVRGVAQVMSGWSIDWSDTPSRYDFAFLPWQHDRSAVSILGGAFTRPARSYGQGYSDGVRLLDVLAHHPSTARYVCWKLVRRFVADVPPPDLVNSAAAVFTANDTAIVPVLRHIISSPHFAAAHRSKVRRPFEQLVASLRALDATMGDDPRGHAADTLRCALEDLGQPIFERPSPDGYPDAAGAWVSSEGLLQRWAMAGRLARNKLTDPSSSDRVVVTLAARLPSPLPATVAALIRRLALDLGGVVLSDADVADLCTAQSLNPAGSPTAVSGSTSTLAQVVGLLLAHPTFQRR